MIKALFILKRRGAMMKSIKYRNGTRKNKKRMRKIKHKHYKIGCFGFERE